MLHQSALSGELQRKPKTIMGIKTLAPTNVEQRALMRRGVDPESDLGRAALEGVGEKTRSDDAEGEILAVIRRTRPRPT